MSTHVLMDLDGTLLGVTNGCRGSVEGYMSYREVFASLWVLYNSGQTEAAPQLPDAECIFAFAARHGIPDDALQSAILEYHRMMGLHVHADARDLLTGLRQRGAVVHAATAGYMRSTLAKLSSVGLDAADGPPFFDRIFSGELVPGGKNSGLFFTTVLDQLRIPPQDALVVGDTMATDAASAYDAGIRRIVIVDRKSGTTVRKAEYGALVVNDLRLALQL